jgi:hypothetical protein
VPTLHPGQNQILQKTNRIDVILHCNTLFFKKNHTLGYLHANMVAFGGQFFHPLAVARSGA